MPAKMLPEKLRSIFRRESGPAYGSQLAAQAAGGVRSTANGLQIRKAGKKEPPVPRQSRGLEQFFFNIRDVVGLSILDCAAANQENIDVLVDLGHKIYSQDLVRSLDEAFGVDPPNRPTRAASITSCARTLTTRPEPSTAFCCGTLCSLCLRRC